MLFASDLDRTLIFSSKFIEGFDANELVCIEYKNDKPISYILRSATEKLVALSSGVGGITFIPTTTRSVAQFKRIDLFDNIEYAITSNGGTILHKGEPLKEWEDYVNKITGEHTLLLSGIIDLVDKQSFILEPCREVDGKFIFFKTGNKASCRDFLDNTLDKETWSFTIQGEKGYIIPKDVTKEKAIDFLAKKLNKRTIVCAGDGKLDEGMLRIANISMIPEGSGILKCSDILECNPILVKGGLYATDDILERILSIKKDI